MILINHGKQIFKVEKYMRIAQIVVKPVYSVKLVESDNLSDTNRGEGGFGSSGLKNGGK